MPFTNIEITHDENATDIAVIVGASANNSFRAINNVINYLRALITGVRSAKVLVATAPVRATGTLTFSSVGANNTLTINGVTFTAKSSGATGDQFNLGSNDTDAATNCAAAINASSTTLITGTVTASSSGAVVTITATRPGITGNCITIAGGQASVSASGARLTGGTQGTERTYKMGSTT